MIAHALSSRLRILLSTQGALVARKPLPFVLLPLIITTILSYGFAFLNKLTSGQSALELYIPNQGLSKIGRERVVELFGDTFQSELDPINGVTFALILQQNNISGDILANDFVTEYLWLRQTLESITVKVNGERFTYSELCWKNPTWIVPTCIPDFFQLVTERGMEGYRDIRLMQYPNTKLTPAGYPFPVSVKMPLGGVRTTKQGFVQSAETVLMTFVFPYHNRAAAGLWEKKMSEILSSWQQRRIKVSWFSMNKFQREFASVSELLKELIPSLMMVVIVVCVASCCVADWVHSKPYLAFGGVIVAVVSCVSGFGLALLIQVPLVDIVYVAPYLILSIGVDDMFLMLAAWRKTSCHLSVEERLAQTFADAAVSITITSLTDVLSFAIGAFSVFPAVRFFCIYTVISLVFTYFYQITLFGAMLAYSGRREAQNRHCFIFAKLKTAAEVEHRSIIYKVFCTGGDGRLAEEEKLSSVDQSTVETSTTAGCSPISPKDNVFDLFFQRYYGPLLRLKGVQILAGISYLAYLAMAVWGATTIKIGINYAELLPDGSITQTYLYEYGKYFQPTFTPQLELLLPAMDLSLINEQQKALELIEIMENGPFTGKADFWLLEFLPYIDRRIGSTHTDFYHILGEFVNHPLYRKYSEHVRYDQEERLVASRILIDTYKIYYGKERDFLNFVKAVLSTSKLNASAFHSAFQLGEQQASVLPAMLQTVAAATGAMLLVSFLLIPKPACSLCLAACIISTNFGVLGAMSLWGVRLDIVSMITVLMSIGISVDFVAHVSYFYVQALELDLSVTKAQRALTYLGLPILQGALSTVCGMLVLLAIQAYMIKAFVKTLLLVIIFGLYHGLLLLPIVLSLFISDNKKKSERNSAEELRRSPNNDIASVSSVEHRAPGTTTTSLPETAHIESATTDVRKTMEGPHKHSIRSQLKRPEKNPTEKLPRLLAVPPNDHELSRTTKVLNWLFLHLDSAQQYPAYSSSTVNQTVA